MRYRIRLNVNWTGKVDGKVVKIKEGKTADVDLDTMRALCFERQIAEPVSVEEIQKPSQKRKSVPRAPKDKMVKKPMVMK